jgi:hypothetical protein
MDVLEYWQPQIDWGRFNQGPLSSDVWACFCDAVKLCHAFKCWKDAVRLHDRNPSRPYYEESAYGRRKRISEHKAQRETLRGHMLRAAFLAAGKILSIAHMAQRREGTPDLLFSIALIKSVGTEIVTDPMRGHERAHFDALAFQMFDATTELTQNSDEMAERWVRVSDRG